MNSNDFKYLFKIYGGGPNFYRSVVDKGTASFANLTIEMYPLVVNVYECSSNGTIYSDPSTRIPEQLILRNSTVRGVLDHYIRFLIILIF